VHDEDEITSMWSDEEVAAWSQWKAKCDEGKESETARPAPVLEYDNTFVGDERECHSGAHALCCGRLGDEDAPLAAVGTTPN